MKGSLKNKIISVFFSVLIVGTAVFSFILPDKYYSETEKRKLTQKEDVKISEYLSGKFQSKLDKYLSDQFPGRNGWISLNTLAGLLSGKRESNGVYFARKGCLIQKFTSYDREIFEANTAAIKRLEDMSEAMGVPFAFMPVPAAAQILSELLPFSAPCLDTDGIVGYIRSQGINVLDAAPALSEHRDEYIYYRTDHHFTSLGAYYCYKCYRGSIGKPCRALAEYTCETLSDSFRGTSYTKVNFPFSVPDTITAFYRQPNRRVSYNNGDYTADSMYERKFLTGKDKYAVFLNSNQAQTLIEGSGKAGRLLLIKDSFGNTFAQFPAEDYEQVHMLDLRFFRGSVDDYIKSNGITEVLAVYGIPNFADGGKIPLPAGG